MHHHESHAPSFFYFSILYSHNQHCWWWRPKRSYRGIFSCMIRVKGHFCAINKLRKDFHIPDFVELRIPNPNENMAWSPEGFVALYLSMFKVGIRLTLHHFVRSFLKSLDITPTLLNPIVHKAFFNHYVLWRRSGIVTDFYFDKF